MYVATLHHGCFCVQVQGKDVGWRSNPAFLQCDLGDRQFGVQPTMQQTDVEQLERQKAKLMRAKSALEALIHGDAVEAHQRTEACFDKPFA